MTLPPQKRPHGLEYFAPPSQEPEAPSPAEVRAARRRRLLGACVACGVAAVPLLIALALVYLTARGMVR
jgi:hypothetical protein